MSLDNGALCEAGHEREVVFLPHTSLLSGHWVCVKLPNSARALGTEAGEELETRDGTSEQAYCLHLGQVRKGGSDCEVTVQPWAGPPALQASVSSKGP